MIQIDALGPADGQVQLLLPLACIAASIGSHRLVGGALGLLRAVVVVGRWRGIVVVVARDGAKAETAAFALHHDLLAHAVLLVTVDAVGRDG